jgi:two-component system response regulator YesN
MKPIRVLVIEDNAADARLIKEVTSASTVPVEIIAAADADNAEHLLADPSFRPDLIIADMRLPKLSADEFVERHGALGIPWVVFSASADPEKIKRALSLGALEYVEKPMDLDAFTEALWRIIWKWTRPGRGGHRDPGSQQERDARTR